MTTQDNTLMNVIYQARVAYRSRLFQDADSLYAAVLPKIMGDDFLLAPRNQLGETYLDSLSSESYLQVGLKLKPGSGMVPLEGAAFIGFTFHQVHLHRSFWVPRMDGRSMFEKMVLQSSEDDQVFAEQLKSYVRESWWSGEEWRDRALEFARARGIAIQVSEVDALYLGESFALSG